MPAWQRSLIGSLSFVALVVLWQAYVSLLHVPAYVVPGPLAVWGEIRFLWSGSLPHDTLVSLKELGEGMLYGVAVGVVLGVAFAQWRTLENIFAPLILLIQTSPKISLAPIIILWFGLGTASKVLLVAVAVFFPVMTAAITAIRSVDPDLVDLTRLLRMSPWQRIRRVELPWAMPSVLAGIRIASTQAITAVVIGELVGSRAGLGYLLYTGQNNADIKMVMASILCLSVLGLVLYDLILWVEHRLVGWHETRDLVVS